MVSETSTIPAVPASIAQISGISGPGCPAAGPGRASKAVVRDAVRQCPNGQTVAGTRPDTPSTGMLPANWSR
ncbi:hypothetical protein C7C46_33705 [Streptomyces tateyamensis]|uniref:Uncharacterized protein n=1 Tax=Streptomyces tateyamensis TaxID=565073 RepID=A0A2V4N6E2_9ACTN|nr:hypothetical protein [Streptomyces tateyamensis]PYC61503.1 hypothetical protein C7C46_33705 [Streptomyces tateyamensis]